MTTYLIHLMIVMVFAALMQRARGRYTTFVFCVLLWGAMVSVPAARNVFVGTDSYNYVSMAEHYDSLSVVFEEQSEMAFGFLCYVSRSLSSDYFVLFLIISGIISLCYIYGIRKYSLWPLLSFFLLMVSIYYGHMNIARQTLAAALLFLAIGCLLESKIWPYLVLCLIATLFHRSAIVFFPLYFIVRQRLTWKQLLLFLLASSLIVIYYVSIIEVVSEVYNKYGGYAEEVDEGRGLVSYTVVLLHCLFFSFFRTYIKEHRNHYDILLSLYILGTLINTVGVLNSVWASGFSRLAMYFTQSMILIWPIIILNLKDKTTRLLFIVVLCILYLIYFILTTNAFASLVPYSLNPSISNWLGY